MKPRRIAFPKNPNCPVCGETPRITTLKEEGLVQCDLKQKDETIWVLTFEGQHRVIKAERALKKEGYAVTPKVTPRQLSHECGICLEVEGGELSIIEEVLANSKLNAVRKGRRSDLA